MSVRGERSISDLDEGLRALKRFIKNSGIGKQSQFRQLTTDVEHHFVITTTLPRQLGQWQPDTEVHVVRIPPGSELYFLERTAASGEHPNSVDDTDFIVNDGSASWRVNTFRRTVKWRRHNFGGKVSHLRARDDAEG